MVSVYASTSTLNAIVQSDVATMRGFVHQGLDPRVLEAPALDRQERPALEGLLGDAPEQGRDPSRRASQPGRTCRRRPATQAPRAPSCRQARSSPRTVRDAQVQVAIVDRGGRGRRRHGAARDRVAAREYLPLSTRRRGRARRRRSGAMPPRSSAASTCSAGTSSRHDHGGAHRGSDPVPRLPRGAGTSRPTVAGAGRGQPARRR